MKLNVKNGGIQYIKKNIEVIGQYVNHYIKWDGVSVLNNSSVRYKNLVELLELNRKHDKGVIFINSNKEDTFISYDGIYKSARSILWNMQAKGVKPGQEMVFQVADNKDFICLFWACILGGLIPVPVTTGVNEEHKKKLLRIFSLMKNPYLIIGEKEYVRLDEYLCKNSTCVEYERIKCRTIFTEAVSKVSGMGKVQRAESGDTAFIQFSSGSTGDPKGVVLSHENLLTNLNAIVQCLGVSSEDTSLGWMPLTHDLGLIGFHLAPLFAGINQYIMSTTLFITNPIKWMDKINQYRISISASPNFGYRHFLNFYKEEILRDWNLSCIKLIINGAEPISASLSNEFYSKMAVYGLKKEAAFPVYGLAEACVAVSFPRVGDGLIPIPLDRKHLGIGNRIRIAENTESQDSVVFVDLGYPVMDCAIRICDDDDKLLGENIIGNIQIKGKNVTSGYYNNTEATKAIITCDGWLRTGDLGFLRKGRLVVTGRKKDIIFVHGQNYYPQDIERAAEETEGIGEGKVAACGVYDKEFEKERIAVFVLFRKNIEAFASLAAEIKKRINLQTGLEVDFVIPIKKIPKTTSGKIQRYRLKEMYEDGEFSEVTERLRDLMDEQFKDKPGDEPRNETDKKLMDIWKKVLGRKSVGITDNYFEIGGDSLKAGYIAEEIYEAFGIELPVKRIFEEATIKELSDYINKAAKTSFRAIEKVEESIFYGVSSAQKRLFALNSIRKGDTCYNISQAVMINGKIDRDRFRNSWAELVRRNESLRTYFAIHMGLPVQKIQQDLDIDVVFLNAEENKLRDVIAEFIKPFDLEKPPLYRICLIEITEDKHLLLLDIHHIIADGTSVGILLKQLIQLYDNKVLPESRIQYKDFAIWQNKCMQESMGKSEEYWINEFLGEIPVLDMPTDYRRASYQSFEGDRLFFELDTSLCNKLRYLARENGVSLFMLLLSAYYILLKKYTNQEDIVVGISTSGRTHPDLKDTVGMFVNTLPLRSRPEGRKLFCDFLKEVKDITLGAYENQSYPFEMLVEKLNIKRDMSRNPLFDTMFVMQNIDMDGFNGDNFTMEFFPIDNKTAKFDLTFFVYERNNKVILEIEYCTKLFKEKTIEHMKEHYCNILKEIANNPKLKLSEIRMLSEKEIEEQIYKYNSTDNNIAAEQTIIGFIEAQCIKTPNNTAVIHNERKLTYKQLDQMVNKLAKLLTARGLKKNDLAAIVADRSIELIACILAVLKVGAAYIPIDPGYPLGRINYMLKDSGAKMLLTQKKYKHQFDFENESIDTEDESIYKGESVSLPNNSKPEDLAYIIYTSGSSGTPKGVMLEHRNLLNYILWASKVYLKGDMLDFPLYTSISFDLTVTSIFTPLITGNSIIIYDDNSDEVLIKKVVKDKKAGIIKATPSHLKLLKDEDNSDSIVKRFIIGGEQLDTKTARAVFERFGRKIEIYNEYGPTEATVGCMVYKFDSEKDIGESVPIGAPADNVQIFLLDRDMNPVPQNVPGEIYISGNGVARGYLGRKELTESKFIDNPFIKGKRMYRTGDLAKMINCDTMEFIGRIDTQVKIRGFRIELEEIEHILMKHPLIEQAVVADKNRNEDSKYLIAYIETRGDISSSEIRGYLMDELPEYMVPAYFVKLDKIPLTLNGKVDKKALPDPGEHLLSSNEYIAPENEKEVLFSRIWSEVLGVYRVGALDNFFELGGDSIKAIQIASRINKAGYDISVRDILTLQTIRQCALNCTENTNKKNYCQDIVEGTIGLTPIIHWFIGLKLKNPNYYNQSVILRLKEIMDIEKLNRVLSKIIEHHDGLRLNLSISRRELHFNNEHLRNGSIVEFYDISSLSEAERKMEMERLCEALKASFDIEKTLLLKCAVINCGNNEQYIFLTAHHIIIDGVSWRILLEDIYNSYMALKNGEDIVMPEKTASVKDWYERCQIYSDKEFSADNKSYWETVGANEFILPLDNDTNDWSYKNLRVISCELGEVYTDKLTMQCHKAYNTEVSDLLLTALVRTVNRWTGRDTVIVELESHGRHFEGLDVSRTLGWFTSIYPVRLKLTDEDIGAQIKAVKEQLRGIPNNGMDYSILKYIKQDKSLQNSIRTQIRFNYLGQFANEAENDLFLFENIKTGRDADINNEMTAVLEMNCMVVKNRFIAEISYNNKALNEARMESFAANYIGQLEQIIDHASNMKEIHFTPSDFNTVELKEEDIDMLFD